MILVAILLFILFWPIWFYSPNVSTDYPLISKELLSSSLNMPYAWMTRTSVGLGENSLFTLWSWPVDFMYGFLGHLGISSDIIQIIVIIISLIVGSYGINKILVSFNFSVKARITSILFYLLNSYYLLLIDGGQLGIAVAYSFLPLSYFYFLESTKGNFRSKLMSALIISLSGFFDVRFLYILFLALGLRFLFTLEYSKKYFFSWISSVSVFLIIFLLLNFYWIYPSVIYGLEIPKNVLSQDNIKFLSFAKFKHALLLLQPHWYKNSFGVISYTRKEFLLIPLFAFGSVLFNRKNKETYFWIIISLLGIILVKGNNPPFENLYAFLFSNLPGFSLFRDPTKFYLLICFGYSILIGFTINKLVKVTPAVFGLFLIYLIILVNPIYLSKMTGLFSKPNNLESFKKVEEIIKADTDFGRVLWVPNRQPLAYVSLNHPVVEASRIQDLRIFANGNFGTYETQNFLRESPIIAQLLELSNIKYVVYSSPDKTKKELSDDEKNYYKNFSEQLSRKDYLDTVYKDENVTLYRVKGEFDKFFVSNNIISLSESDSLLNTFKYKSLSSLKNNTVIINNDRNNMFYYPSDSLSNSPDENGWWKRSTNEFFWLRNFLEEKYQVTMQDLDYGGGWSICEGICTYTLPGFVNNWDEIWVRKLVVSDKKVYKKISGNQVIKDRIFEFKDSTFEWVKLDNKVEKIHLNSEVNIINAISPFKPEEDEYFITTKTSNTKVRYLMLDPTHYKITVTNLDKPGVLVFSESFSKYWYLDDQKSFKVYDIFNGFYVESNGEYDLHFAPQKEVNSGIKVTLISALVIFIYIIAYGKNSKRSKDRNS